MILTDREIKLALAGGSLVIDPRPVDRAFASTSVDLTLDSTILEFLEKKIPRHLDPGGTEHTINDMMKEETARVILTDTQPYLLEPGKLILAWTVEYLDLRRSPRLAARVEGKSSLGRMGLGVHVTAPTIHAGFEGQLQLEVINHGRIPIRLRPGMRICQVIFEQTLGTPDALYQGQFAGQKSN